MAAVAEHPFRPEHFQRYDNTLDAEFYRAPRLVVHIDDGAIRAVAQLYAELLPPGGEVLDLMSSWRSHLPETVVFGRVAGLGMNAVEMEENPQLSEYVVHDLNADPVLPFEASSFDGAICTVSVQYLIRPLEVFREVRRVLRPGAPFVLTFSNRCFPTKAVRAWQMLDDAGHAQLIASYFHYSGGWSEAEAEDRSPRGERGDPLYAVYARKLDNSLHS